MSRMMLGLALLCCLVGCKSVAVQSTPPGASVYYDGEYKGKTPMTLDITKTPGTLGSHLLVIRKDGYEEWTTTFKDRGPLPFTSTYRDAHAELKPLRASHAGCTIQCDLRIVNVMDGSSPASASGEATTAQLDKLATALAAKLREGMLIKNESIAVVGLRNRNGTGPSRALTDQLADKLQGELIRTGWFDVKERIELRGVLDEQELESAGLVKNTGARKKLAGVKYVVIGGVTVNGDPATP